MGLIETLTRLDARVLPRLARGLARLSGRRPRRPVRPLVVVAAVLAAAVLATAVWRLGEPSAQPGTTAVRVGVSQDQSIPGYAEGARRELVVLTAGPEADQQVYALVSSRRTSPRSPWPVWSPPCPRWRRSPRTRGSRCPTGRPSWCG